jgi:hypothetical protein
MVQTHFAGSSNHQCCQQVGTSSKPQEPTTGRCSCSHISSHSSTFSTISSSKDFIQTQLSLPCLNSSLIYTIVSCLQLPARPVLVSDGIWVRFFPRSRQPSKWETAPRYWFTVFANRTFHGSDHHPNGSILALTLQLLRSQLRTLKLLHLSLTKTYWEEKPWKDQVASNLPFGTNGLHT